MTCSNRRLIGERMKASPSRVELQYGLRAKVCYAFLVSAATEWSAPRESMLCFFSVCSLAQGVAKIFNYRNA